MEGLPLVGRVPSELGDLFVRYAESRGVQVQYSQEGYVGAEAFGFVMRTQQADDALLTRPVFVAREWADSVADAQLGFVPQAEWMVRR
ncbi:hypothetical protein F8566_16755 [Actinomadura rudentiformis]|uniref:Uncharacterized protein n=1 Tax=Actinomadura rudentiformis TaxID=359158 RepID=A0A6H9YVJ3_9ACTN|nr:hypothetical protein F8566_16755 [Actinomadura rudentiformis]